MKYNLIVLLCLFLQTSYFMQKKDLSFNVFTEKPSKSDRNRMKYLIDRQKSILDKNKLVVDLENRLTSKSVSKKKALERAVSIEKERLIKANKQLTKKLFGSLSINEESSEEESDQESGVAKELPKRLDNHSVLKVLEFFDKLQKDWTHHEIEANKVLMNRLNHYKSQGVKEDLKQMDQFDAAIKNAIETCYKSRGLDKKEISIKDLIGLFQGDTPTLKALEKVLIEYVNLNRQSVINEENKVPNLHYTDFFGIGLWDESDVSIILNKIKLISQGASLMGDVINLENKEDNLQDKPPRGKHYEKNQKRKNALKNKVEQKGQENIKVTLTEKKNEIRRKKELIYLFNDNFFNIIRAKNFSKVLDWFIKNKPAMKAIDCLKKKLGDIDKENIKRIGDIIENISRLYDTKSPQSITIDDFLSILTFMEEKNDTLSAVKKVLSQYWSHISLVKGIWDQYCPKAPEVTIVDVFVSGVLGEKDLEAMKVCLDKALQKEGKTFESFNFI
jgi:hypothetical protein